MAEDSEINPETKQNPPLILQRDKVVFSLDVSLRFFFRELWTEAFLQIINEVCHADFPLDSEVLFLDTDGRDPVGPSAKYHVRGDLVAHVKAPNGSSQKIAIEFQSYDDKDMGIRMFIYALNTAKKDEGAYKFQKSITFYLTNRPQKRGFDEARIDLEQFRVESPEKDCKYQSEEGDTLVAGFPFINLLAMDWAEFQEGPWEYLKALYCYRYIQDKDLIKKDDRFREIIEEVGEFVEGSKDSRNREALLNLWNAFVAKIMAICMENKADFEKELEFMKQSEVRLCDVLRAEGREEWMEKGREEGMEKGREEGENKKTKEVIVNTYLALKPIIPDIALVLKTISDTVKREQSECVKILQEQGIVVDGVNL